VGQGNLAGVKEAKKQEQACFNKKKTKEDRDREGESYGSFCKAVNWGTIVPSSALGPLLRN